MENIGVQFDVKLAQTEMAIVSYFSVPEVITYIDALNHFTNIKVSGVKEDSKNYLNSFKAVKQLEELPQVAAYLETIKLHAKLMKIKKSMMDALNINEDLSRK